MDTLAEISAWVRKSRLELGWTGQDLAERAGALAAADSFKANITQQAIAGLEGGRLKKRPLWFRYVQRAIEDAASQAQGSAVVTHAPELDDLHNVSVPHLSLSYSMGGGVLVEEPVVLGHFSVPREWVRGRIAGRIEDVAFIMGEGDSMFPTIKDGDMLMIDRAQRAVRQQDQIWAIAMHDVGMVKRLRRTRDGYEIHSDNPSIPPDRAHDGEMTIVGRVIWVGSWK